ncbi:MAG TPA: hypothetical protein VH540_08255 [Ktedonobacterales bacterium]|jgi:hypothetical protein
MFNPSRSQPHPFPSQTGALAPHPVITELKALESVLRVYLRIGAPHWVPRPSDHHPLAGIDRHLFEVESYVATVLSFGIPGFLLITARQRARGRRFAGGRGKRYLPRDLDQHPADVQALRRMSSDALCLLLRDELRLLLRLLRATQQSYWSDPAGFEWEKRHRAAMQVLERILHICAALRRRVNRWYAEVCLRDALLDLWTECFGPKVSVGQWWKWLLPIEVPEKAERRIAKRLAWEQAQGQTIPEQFLDLLAAWERGELQQPVAVGV